MHGLSTVRILNPVPKVIIRMKNFNEIPVDPYKVPAILFASDEYHLQMQRKSVRPHHYAILH